MRRIKRETVEDFKHRIDRYNRLNGLIPKEQVKEDKQNVEGFET